MRIDLPNGDWVDLVDRLNYGQQQRIAEATGNRNAVGVAAMVRNWSLRDDDGEPIPLPAVTVRGVPVEALDAIPLAHALILIEAAGDVAERSAGEIPKASGATSSESPPAPRSGSRQSSQTPTSSRGMDGVGTISSPPHLT